MPNCQPFFGLKSGLLLLLAIAVACNETATSTPTPNGDDAATNSAPVVQDVQVEIDEDQTIEVQFDGDDIDNNSLTYSVVRPPAHGQIKVDEQAGVVRYIPEANYFGTDSLTYKASDGVSESTPGTITIAIKPVNDVPSVYDLTLQLLEDAVAAGTVTGTDIDDEELAFELVTAPTKGVVVLQANGSFTYTPHANAHGLDEFSFVAQDGAGSESNIGLVLLTIVSVNDAPAITAAVIAGGPYRAADELQATAQGWSDADGDAPGYLYRWFVNGAEVAGQTSNKLSGVFVRANTVQVEITPNDGVLLGPPRRSNVITIANTPPSLVSANIPANFYNALSTVTVTATGATDIDGDTVTFAYQWYRNGLAITGATNATLAAGQASRGDQVLARVWPYDGELTGAAVDSTTVAFVNAPPTIQHLQMFPTAATDDSDLWVTVLAEDADGDELTYRYTWYRNGSDQGYPQTQTLVAANQTAIDETWRVVVEIDDGFAGVVTDWQKRYIWPYIGFTVVAAGGYHTCAVSNDGRLFCWGVNWLGQLGDGTWIERSQPTQVGSDNDWVYVTAGEEHSCALKTSGQLYCWGNGGSGQLGIGDVESEGGQKTMPVLVGQDADWVKVEAGDWYTCAIKNDGRLFCWGDNGSGQLGDGGNDQQYEPTQVGEASNWESIAAGAYHTCAINISGELYCWGGNGSGQLGNGEWDDVNTPIQVGLDMDWVGVAAGEGHTCAIKNDGRLYCWGYGGSGQVGDGTWGEYYNQPVQIADEGVWVGVVANGEQTCALDISSALYCWGGNWYGQLGNGTNENQNTPTQVGTDTNWAFVSAGGEHACAVNGDGALYCWGYNGLGQLGDGLGGSKNAPAQTMSVNEVDDEWSLVAGGSSHTCALRENGRLYCWGSNGYGQLGYGDDDVLTPRLVNSDADWDRLAVGGDHTCAIKDDGRLYCWGGNWLGQLGNGTWNIMNPPMQVGASLVWDTVSAGIAHTCAIDDGAALYCWGYNNAGQLGIGNQENQNQPQQVGEAIWLQVATGRYHTCAIDENSQLYCWGGNGAGQLGIGGTIDENVPLQVGSDSDWASVSTGDGHTCALKFNGELYCWGGNNAGQLGIGNQDNQDQPQQVGSDNDWMWVKASGDYTCALKNNRTLYCWGNNEAGQLGDGSNDNSNTPIPIGAFTDWQQLGGGYVHNCAVADDGKLYCWGENGYGQLGDESYDNQLLPKQVKTYANWHDLDLGVGFGCAIKDDGRLFCWGEGESGQLGRGDYSDLDSPHQIGKDSDWLNVAAGYQHACAVKNDGRLYCWGDNHFGGLGLGHNINQDMPVQVGGDSDWRRVAAGEYHTCAIKTSGELYCWGANWDGQLGIGSSGDQYWSPLQVGNDADWVSLALGEEHTCASKTSGELYCWGNNEFGQLGDGTNQNRLVPTLIAEDYLWQSVATGAYHTCAIDDEGAVYCWGVNWYGQLGDGTNTIRHTPNWVELEDSQTNLAVGRWHSCVNNGDLDGEFFCWGGNWSGQLGDGVSWDNQNIPVSVVDGHLGWGKVAAGENHTCAIDLQGELYCWGSNWSGELGNGAAWRLEPVLIPVP